MLDNGLPPGISLNVNIPKSVIGKKINGIKICRQAKANGLKNLIKDKTPKTTHIIELTGKFVNLDNGEDTDERALENHFVSVVPIQFDLTAYQEISKINNFI